jgi:hypothetical protein
VPEGKIIEREAAVSHLAIAWGRAPRSMADAAVSAVIHHEFPTNKGSETRRREETRIYENIREYTRIYENRRE